MTNNQIIIPLDFSNLDNLRSYYEVKAAIEQGEPLIYTTCLEFFSFYYLEKGYDVKVVKKNGEYIILSELLTDRENVYIRKEIRKAHDARRLLLAHAFQFKQGNNQEH